MHRPFVTRDRLENAKQWKFQVCNSVFAWGNCLGSRNIFIRGGGSDLGKASCKSSTNFESIRTIRLPNRLGSKGIIINICCASGKKPCPSSEARVLKAKSRPSSGSKQLAKIWTTYFEFAINTDRLRTKASSHRFSSPGSAVGWLGRQLQ